MAARWAEGEDDEGGIQDVGVARGVHRSPYLGCSGLFSEVKRRHCGCLPFSWSRHSMVSRDGELLGLFALRIIWELLSFETQQYRI